MTGENWARGDQVNWWCGTEEGPGKWLWCEHDE